MALSRASVVWLSMGRPADVVLLKVPVSKLFVGAGSLWCATQCLTHFESATGRWLAGLYGLSEGVMQGRSVVARTLGSRSLAGRRHSKTWAERA